MTEPSTFQQKTAPQRRPNTLPPPASIWHRIGALIIDGALLGFLGHLIGWLFWPLWFQMGPHARFIGLPVILLYFGLLNATLGGGQTVGKRVAKIAVRDNEGQPINLGPSLLRTGLLVTPYFLSNWAWPPLEEFAVLRWLQIVLVIGLGGAILYSLRPNRKADQGLHDRVGGSYVVLLSGRPVAAYTPLGRADRVGIGGFLLTGLIVATVWVGGQSFLFDPPPTFAADLEAALKEEIPALDVRLSDRTVDFSRTGPVRFLDVGLWHQGYLDSPETRSTVMAQIAVVVLNEVENINEFDELTISLTMGYDLAIAQRHLTANEHLPIDEWRQQVAP